MKRMFMLKCSLSHTVAVGLIFGGTVGAETVLHVAPNGSDTNDGSAAKPLQTIVGARNAVRRIEKNEPIRVRIGPGRYFIDETITFEPVDAGTKAAPIIYEGAGPGRTIISGGMPVTGWQLGEGGLWQTRIDRVAAGDLYFHQLFVNG